MKKWINKYFDFTRKEFNGLLVLMGLILAMIGLPYGINWLWPDRNVGLSNETLLRKFEKGDETPSKRLPYRNSERGYVIKRTPQLFRFDPNLLSQEGWEKLGFSPKQAQVFLKYLKKGGRFRKPEDLKKMFVMSPAMFEKLEPFIRIGPVFEEEQRVDVYKKNIHSPAEPVLVEVNSADTIGLDKIKGIGPAFARRIVKYREKLGGFYKKEQLMEVFGLDSAKFMEIKDQITVDASKMKRLNINTAVFQDFKGHPYLTYKQINSILEYRKQHGNYLNIADLNKIAILTPQQVEKLGPYLSFDHD